LGFSTFFPAFIIFLFGADINAGRSWSIFKELGIGENIMEGIFSWPKEGFGSGKVNALTFAVKHNYFTYIYSYLISFIVLIYLLYRNRLTFKSIMLILLIHFILLLISLPIFYLTIDWGRWLNIHFVCTILVVSIFYQNYSNEEISLSKIFTFVKKKKFVAEFIILLVLTFGFSMKHVDDGFLLGQNNLLTQIRDLFWQIRHLNF
jgi:hypothetical protein